MLSLHKTKIQLVIGARRIETIWLVASASLVPVLSVASVNVPVDPRSNLTAAGTDIQLQTSGEVAILIETQRMPVTAQVEVIVNPLGGWAIRKHATHQSGDAALATWVARVAVPEGFAAVQVRAVAP